MQIRKPVGAILTEARMVGGSYVDVVVMESPDGIKDLQFRHSRFPGKAHPVISMSDLQFIIEWAQKEEYP